MAVRLENVTLDCHDERVLAAFWTAALGWEIVVDHPGDWLVLRDPSGAEPALAFQVVPEPKVSCVALDHGRSGGQRVLCLPPPMGAPT